MGLYKQYFRMGQTARNKLWGLPQEGQSTKKHATPLQMLISQQGRPCSGRLLVILIGIVTLALGIVLSSIPWLDYLILKQLRLANGSLSYYYWQKPGVIRLTKVYIFNVTNPESFLKMGEKPRLQEVGPFVYREEMEKVNIKFHDNGTVSYQHKKILQFVPELSVDKDEKLVVPNIPLLTLSTQSNSLGYFLQKTISFVLTVGKFEPFVTVKADELVFGYDDRLVALAHQFYPKRKRPMSKMGLLITRNGTLPEIHNLHTGYTGMSNFGLLDKLNGADRLPYWPEKPCSDIKASEGSFFPPREYTKSDLVHLYDKDLCRILPMKYTSSGSKHGIAVDVYTPPEETFETVAHAPENKCFCPGNEYCPPKGLQNISPCQYDAPVYLSFPHFYQADPSLLTRFEGLQPRKEMHQNYFMIQPRLGVPLEGKIRVQLNLKIEKAESVTPVATFPSIIFPIMWVEEGIDDVTPAIRRWVYLATTFSDVAAPLLTYGSLFFGSCVLIGSFINAYKSFVFTKETIEEGVARLRRTSQAYIGSHTSFMLNTPAFLRESYSLLTDTPPDEEELKLIAIASR